MKIKGKEGLVKQAFVKPTDGFCFQPKQVTLNILIEQVSSFTLDVKKKEKKDRVLCLLTVSFKKILKHCTEKHSVLMYMWMTVQLTRYIYVFLTDHIFGFQAESCSY